MSASAGSGRRSDLRPACAEPRPRLAEPSAICLAHARVLLERFRVEYTTEHLDSTLGHLTPEEHAAGHPAGAA